MNKRVAAAGSFSKVCRKRDTNKVAKYDRLVACVTTNDRFFVGRLRATPGNDQWIALQIEGAVDPVVFYLDFVKELYLIR